jgi:hypothetical protein
LSLENDFQMKGELDRGIGERTIASLLQLGLIEAVIARSGPVRLAGGSRTMAGVACKKKDVRTDPEKRTENNFRARESRPGHGSELSSTDRRL